MVKGCTRRMRAVAAGAHEWQWPTRTRPATSAAATPKRSSLWPCRAVRAAHLRAGASIHNDPDYAGGGFRTLAPRMWAQAGIGPGAVDVVKAYDNFTGAW